MEEKTPLAERVPDDPLAPPETLEADGEVVACDGGGGVLGHPKVWLNMEGKGFVDCPYCDRRFVHRPSAGAAPHH